jgi:predicted nucleic acid-binding protein
MKVIADADISSAFAKVNRLDLLVHLFENMEVVITSEIYQELLVPLNYGFQFPNRIFAIFDVIYLEENEATIFQRFLFENPKLGRGELEAITICMHRNYAFCAIDKRALDFAQQQGVTIFPLDVVLRLLWIKNILSQAEVKQLIYDLEKKDNLTIKEQERIFTVA